MSTNVFYKLFSDVFIKVTKLISGAKEYVTSKGDSCHELGFEYGLTKDEFMAMNPGVKCKGGLVVGFIFIYNK